MRKFLNVILPAIMGTIMMVGGIALLLGVGGFSVWPSVYFVLPLLLVGCLLLIAAGENMDTEDDSPVVDNPIHYQGCPAIFNTMAVCKCEVQYVGSKKPFPNGFRGRAE